MESNSSDSVSGSSFDYSRFRPCSYLRGLDFTDQDLSHFYFSQADCTYTKFIRTNLNNTILRSADLRFASLTGASLLGTDLRDIKLNSTDFRGAIYNSQTLFPQDFDPRVAGLILLIPVKTVTVVKRQLQTV